MKTTVGIDKKYHKPPTGVNIMAKIEYLCMVILPKTQSALISEQFGNRIASI